MKRIATLLFMLACYTLSFAQVNNNNHDYVDLGLPSGTLWSTKPVNGLGNSYLGYPGEPYQWGETTKYENAASKSGSWYDYKYCTSTYQSGSYYLDKLTKYNTNETYGTIDNLVELQLSDDAARSNWKGDWRMPTIAQFKELETYCTKEIIKKTYGVDYTEGVQYTGPNGNSIYMAYKIVDKQDITRNLAYNIGMYWTRELYLKDNNPSLARSFSPENGSSYSSSRCKAYMIRPVIDGKRTPALPSGYTSTYSFCVDGIYYGIDDAASGTVKVTYFSYNSTEGKAWSDYSGNINIPSTVTYNGKTYTVVRIGNYAFDNSTGVTNVTIAEGPTKLGNYSFRNCEGLTTITIPSTIASIGDECFSGCTSLNEFTSKATTPPTLGANAFKDVDCKNGTLYVPAGSVDLYKNADGWKEWGTILPIGYVPPKEIALVDGEPYDNATDKQMDNVTYSKTIGAAGKWTALYVPIAIDVEKYLDQFELAEIFAVCPYSDTNGDGTIDGDDENKLLISKLKTGVTLPNMPYLIRAKEARQYTIEAADNILYKSEINSIITSTSMTHYTFTGVYANINVVGDTKYYMTGGILDFSPVNPVTIKPYRWYMTKNVHGYGQQASGSSGAAKGMEVIIIGEDIDETTAIRLTHNANSAEQGTVYTLDGRKIQRGAALPAGLYIKDGKKFIIK